jgi:hypothetical protein
MPGVFYFLSEKIQAGLILKNISQLVTQQIVPLEYAKQNKKISNCQFQQTCRTLLALFHPAL